MLRPPHTGYVMELLKGMEPINSLFSPPKGEEPSPEWYNRSGGLRRRLILLARTAGILARIHGKGLAYSDPSPANIFVSSDPNFKEVWLIDTDNLQYKSQPGSGVYTPFYGAPELVRGESGVNTLTDVHAFAVIAFRLLTLAHPFLGDMVIDGEPELEEQALKGMLPWIEDKTDDSNRTDLGIPRSWVLSNRLNHMFEETFGPGRTNPALRPGPGEWEERLFAAADATLACSSCGGTFYFKESKCPWCDTPRPSFATMAFYLWDPEHEKKGGLVTKRTAKGNRIRKVDSGVVTEGETVFVTRRQAFGRKDGREAESVLQVTLQNSEVRLKSLDGNSYRFVSSSRRREIQVDSTEKRLQLTPGVASWRLHFGSDEKLHRTVVFELRSGESS
jgi:serine/threonine protein kinase